MCQMPSLNSPPLLPRAARPRPPLKGLVPNQSCEITFAPLQMQSPLRLLLPLPAVRAAEPPSLHQLYPPQRGSEFMLPSCFHRRSGDHQNANANDLLLPRLRTCRRSTNLRSSPVESLQPSNKPHYSRQYPLFPMPRSTIVHYLTFFPRTPVTSLSIGSQERYLSFVHSCSTTLTSAMILC